MVVAMIVHTARRKAVRTFGRSAAKEAGRGQILFREEAEGGENLETNGFAPTASTCERASRATTLEVWGLSACSNTSPRQMGLGTGQGRDCAECNRTNNLKQEAGVTKSFPKT